MAHSFKDFIEVCERRNLFTHTAGIVSAQYLAVCKTHKIDTKDVGISQQLEADPEYFKKSVEVVFEIAMKLCFTLWRKFDVASSEEADQMMVEFCFDLIFKRHYTLAESLLSYSSSVSRKYKGNDKVRRMMIVNLGNAIRLQGRNEDACRVLDEEDWSASSDLFQICVEAARGDTKRLAEKMKELGSSSITAEDYRSWPVFRGHRTKSQFNDAFKTLFGNDVMHEEKAGKVENKSVSGIMPSELH